MVIAGLIIFCLVLPMPWVESEGKNKKPENPFK